jgi:hypothetical protein
MIEDYEKQPEEKGMRRWCIVSEDRKNKFMLAAESAGVELIHTAENTDKYQIWSYPDQDMEKFWEKFNELEAQK